jgi:hypothetical protein
MNNQFVPYNLAMYMKELGFDESSRWLYHDGKLVHTHNFKPRNHNAIHGTIEVTAPLYQEAFDWFREKRGLHGIIYPYSETKSDMYGWMIWFIGETDNGHVTKNIKSSMTDAKPLEERCWTPENAQQKCIEKMIKIVKGEDNE